MKIITWNINGYRSADKDGYVKELIEKNDPDIICIQEMKMNQELKETFGYYSYYNFAHKKGYSGTLILTKEKPLHTQYAIGLEQFDQEGRFILLEYEKFVLMNIYIPHGGRQKENHPYKFSSIHHLLEAVKKCQKPVIICTDFNIAHTELDVKNYKTNYKNNMFTKEEREKIDELLNLGFVDSFRVLEKNGNIYSWWSNRFDARKRNMGWRIDYIFVSKTLENKIKQATYLKEQLGSDHCPYKLNIEI